jgi:hypothetical protein
MPTSLMAIANTGCIPSAEAKYPEEPSAGKLHAGICAGDGGQPPFLPRRRAYNKLKRDLSRIVNFKT